MNAVDYGVDCAAPLGMDALNKTDVLIPSAVALFENRQDFRHTAQRKIFPGCLSVRVARHLGAAAVRNQILVKFPVVEVVSNGAFHKHRRQANQEKWLRTM